MSKNNELTFNILKVLSYCNRIFIFDTCNFEWIKQLKNIVEKKDKIIIREKMDDSEIDIEILLNYYLLYEFTDVISMISDVGQFGSLLNYYNIGLINEEELIEALLYK